MLIALKAFGFDYGQKGVGPSKKKRRKHLKLKP
jgi:hypothetical protein